MEKKFGVVVYGKRVERSIFEKLFELMKLLKQQRRYCKLERAYIVVVVRDARLPAHAASKKNKKADQAADANEEHL